MNKLPRQQIGASVIVNIIILAVLGYAVYVGIQYAPQIIESRAIKSILSSVETDHRIDPITTEYAAKAKVITLLQINEMNDMVKNVNVRESGDLITITIKYERVLNLGYKEKKIQYETARTLR